jgi:hypothetical protein
MTINPADFQNPEVPTNNREFYMLYFQNMGRIKESFDGIEKRLDGIIESQADDRDNMMAIFAKWDEWKKCHDADLAANLKE